LAESFSPKMARWGRGEQGEKLFTPGGRFAPHIPEGQLNFLARLAEYIGREEKTTSTFTGREKEKKCALEFSEGKERALVPNLLRGSRGKQPTISAKIGEKEEVVQKKARFLVKGGKSPPQKRKPKNKNLSSKSFQLGRQGEIREKG